MAELIIRSGKQQGKKLVLPATRVLIGRDKTCHLRLASNDVSRQHCSLRITPEGIHARDLGSRNGTLVNDVAITGETLLQPGDMLRIGPIVFEVPKKKAAATAGREPVRPPDPQDATDDNIVAWLSDEYNGVDTGDTTIISNKSKKETGSIAPKPAKRRQFKNVAEEAADIIRRHREAPGQSDAQEKPTQPDD